MSKALAGVAVCLAVALSGCVSMSRTLSYGSDLADAKAVYWGKEYSFFLHPKDDTFLIQRGMATVIGREAVSTMTLGAYEPGDPYDAWKAAANEFLKPVGCSATDLYRLGSDLSWEVRYSCPTGTDLHTLVPGQRVDLRAGKPLKP